MSESFELPVHYNGQELLLPAEFLPMGYTHKIKLTIGDVDLLFEPDEERNYRATITEADRDKIAPIKKDFLSAICEGLEKAFR